MTKKVLVTGAAGFIGSHVSKLLRERGDAVVGIDNLNAYYDVSLKEARLEQIASGEGFKFLKIDITDREAIKQLFAEEKFEKVVHLAAQAGVRYSLQNPYSYIDANIQGFINILEACRHNTIEHLVYASSSSVYGANTQMPFSVHHNVDHPLSLYAATKKANELMAHTYSHLYQLPTTGLRFFTVYGPWGRPDMSLFMFTRNIFEGKPIDVFNNGDHARDFTYIDDIANGVVSTLDNIASSNIDWDASKPDPATSSAPYRLFNIGNNKPVKLMDYIHILEQKIGKKAALNMLPMQPGDVRETYADIEELARVVGYRPDMSIEKGIECFVDWYKDYYKV
ncbi:MAG: NAD-dependent epimerase [Gammaproteobacteria bacterium]